MANRDFIAGGARLSREPGFRVMAAAIAAFLALAAWSPAVAQTPAPAAQALPKGSPAASAVMLRVWPHKNYGRIVFDWPGAATHGVKLVNRALTVSFDKPLAAALDDIPARLGNYAVAARLGEDGRSAVVTLKAGVRFKSFASGNSVIVDLLPAQASAADAGPGARLSVPIRIGSHATFSRFVFDWPRGVEYSLSGSSPRAEIHFSRKGGFDLAALRQSLPALLRSIAAKDVGEGTTVMLDLADGAELRHFRSGMSVVVDVLRPAKPAAKGKKEPGPSGRTAKARGKAAPQPAAVAGKPVAATAQKKPATTTAKTPVANGSKPQGPVALFDMQGKAANVLAERLARNESAPTSLLPAKAVSAARGAVPVILALNPATAVIKFHWPDEVGAAVFERAGYLWAVFDREARLAFEGWDEALAKPSPNSKRRPEEKPAAAFVARPQFSATPGTTVFRMKIPVGANPRVGRDKAAWVVTLEREYLKPASGVAVESHFAAAAGARLFISHADAGQAVAVSDPEVGDRIWVVPIIQSDKGIGLSRRFAEVELFATAQGIAGRAMSDHITFRTLPKGVEIASQAGLALSGVSVVLERTDKLEAVAQNPRSGQSRPGWLFDFESWRRESTGTLVENKHILQRAAALAPPTARNTARLDLAQLYFAHDHLTDVLGLLQVIEQDEPELAQEPVFRAMRGAVHYRLGDYERAARDLDHNSLDRFKEIGLWRAALAVTRNDWVSASRFFSRAETIMRVYPLPLRIHFGLRGAETSLNIGDVGLAKFHLDTLDELNPDKIARAHINYLRGRLLAKVRDPEGAVAAWTTAIEGPDRRIRVVATLARTDLLLDKEKITKAEAARDLEKLRFTWRGDELEFKALMRLGRAYLDINDYKNGLVTLRELATHFPKHPEADKVIDAMRTAFVKLYVDGAADKVPPLTALALYDQFRELTPEGPVGDKVISRLAERLVAVDLLDRAASLIKHLIDQRLKGTDRFDAANRLALVYLLDRKPQEALDALAGQVPGHIIPQWATTRRHLKARALAELSRYKEGLALIAGDVSLEAEILRAEIFWKLRDWTEATGAYARIIKDTVKDGAKGTNGEPVEAVLDDDGQRNVLSLAIAYALGRNQPALKDLRLRFLGRMAKGDYKESFDVVTAPSGNVPDDYRVISSKVAEVDQFRTFMKSYREKLLQRGRVAAPRPGPSAAAPAAAQG